MDIELQLAVENLLARYAHALDEDRLEEWPDFFVETGCYRVTTAENHGRGLPVSIIYADSRAMLRDRVSALERDVGEALRQAGAQSEDEQRRVETFIQSLEARRADLRARLRVKGASAGPPQL